MISSDASSSPDATAGGPPPHGVPPVRVAMVIQNYLPTVGGAERQLASLIPRLDRQGIESIVITRSRPGQPNREVLGGAEIRRVRVIGPKPMRSVLFVIGAVWNLLRLRPDVVHGYDTLSPALIAGIHKTITGTPYLTKLLRSGTLGDLTRLEAKPLGSLRMRLLKRTVDRFVVISRDLETELEARSVEPPNRVFIPNGVDTERFRPPTVDTIDPERRWELRQQELPDWPVAPVVLVVGRISPEKRVVDLAHRWNEVRLRVPNAWLFVVGEGPLEPQLAGIDGVRVLGKREDVPLLLRWSDLYVSASAAEGLSNALLEAMASGCACVVTDAGGVADVMTDSVDGRIVPNAGNAGAVDPVAGVVAGIVSLLDDPIARYDLGAAARTTVRNRYSIIQTVAALAAEYRAMAGVAPGPGVGTDRTAD